LILILNALQLIIYIALLALAGQGLLFLLSGQKREGNLFYQLFQVLNKPWMFLARKLAPARVAPQHHGFVAFFVLSVIYIAVTLAKIEHCISVEMVGCK
jgi:hypothetical protein